MKLVFLLLLAVHGLIHVLGFVKSFGLAQINQLTVPISKLAGFVWLLAFLLFAVTALWWGLRKEYWWITGIAAVVVSQGLIFYAWQDAKFGTLANVLIVLVLIVGYSTWSYARRYVRDVQKSFQQAPLPASADLLTEADIHPLPEPVRRYLRQAGCLGKPKVHNFKVTLTGQLRSNDQSEWMPFTSEQHNFMQPSTRLFFLNATMKHLPVTGYHRFSDGAAFMDIRLLSLFRVQYQTGKEMDVAETVTFFNDMCCMAPATLIDPRIRWLEVQENTVHASFTNARITVEAWLSFNDQGALVNFLSHDRYSTDAGQTLPWTTPLSEPATFSGHRLMRQAEAVYAYPDRKFTYGRFTITHIEYNVSPTH